MLYLQRILVSPNYSACYNVLIGAVQIQMPEWLQGDVIDVRKEVVFWSEGKPSGFRRLPRVRVYLVQSNITVLIHAIMSRNREKHASRWVSQTSYKH